MENSSDKMIESIEKIISHYSRVKIHDKDVFKTLLDDLQNLVDKNKACLIDKVIRALKHNNFGYIYGMDANGVYISLKVVYYNKEYPFGCCEIDLKIYCHQEDVLYRLLYALELGDNSSWDNFLVFYEKRKVD